MFIYGLIDPVTKELRYVGKTNNIRKRFSKHLNEFDSVSHKISWIKQLKKNQFKPEIIELDNVLDSDWEFWGQWHIAYFNKKNNILSKMYKR